MNRSTGQLVLRDELEQHPERRRVHQPHADVDVLDPQLLQVQLHRSAMHAHVRDVAAGAHELGAHVERGSESDRLDRDIDAVAVGQREHLLLPVSSPGVDPVGGANRLGDLEPVVVQVDGDDLCRAVERGGGDDGETDRTGTDDGDRVAGLHPPVLHSDLEAGGQDVRQQQRSVVRDAVRQLVERVVGERDADQLGLRAVDEVTEDPADAGRALVGEAVRRVAAATVGADAARADARDDDAVAGDVVADRGADSHDGSDSLVPEDPALGDGGNVALEDVQVGSADGRGVDAHDGVRGVGENGVGNLVPALPARTVVDECLHEGLRMLFAGAPCSPPCPQGSLRES